MITLSAASLVTLLSPLGVAAVGFDFDRVSCCLIGSGLVLYVPYGHKVFFWDLPGGDLGV